MGTDGEGPGREDPLTEHPLVQSFLPENREAVAALVREAADQLHLDPAKVADSLRGLVSVKMVGGLPGILLNRRFPSIPE